MKNDETTRGIAAGILFLYCAWALVTLGVIGFLSTVSIGLVVYATYDNLILASSSTVAAGLLYYTILVAIQRRRAKEAFANASAIIAPAGPSYLPGNYTESTDFDKYPGAPNPQSLEDIARRVAAITGGTKPNEIRGMMGSKFAEGFADVSVTEKPNPDAGSETGSAKKDKEEAAPSSEKPTPVEDTAKVSEELKKDLPKEETVSQFKDVNPDASQLFRLGSIPTDTKGGPHIDAATTLVNALNALKPDQVKEMTDDTRKLMETQKNLMGMLENMKPMLQDGKQLLETFGTMFNK